MSHACKNFPYRIAQKYIILFYRDFDNFQKKVKFQKKINFLLHACKIYLHRTALDSQKYIILFYQDFDPFQKKVKFQKKIIFVGRMQNLPTLDSPRFSKIHNSLLSGFRHFSEKSKFQKNNFFSHVCLNLLHQTSLDSEKCINSVFCQFFDTFQKKLKFKKKIIYCCTLAKFPSTGQP